ncbi:MAG TPA: hypothetical protein VIP98_19660 [Microlunatus sp.]
MTCGVIATKETTARLYVVADLEHGRLEQDEISDPAGVGSIR